VKVHIGWWTPVSTWAPMCDPRWSCRECSVGLAINEFVMGKGSYTVTITPEQEAQVTCGKCLRIWKRKPRAEGGRKK
jgi:hypothetical protein